MLNQNWLNTSNMFMVEDYYDSQLFYDFTSKCFYLVEYMESKFENNKIVITQISSEDEDYEKLKVRYKDVIAVEYYNNHC